MIHKLQFNPVRRLAACLARMTAFVSLAVSPLGAQQSTNAFNYSFDRGQADIELQLDSALGLQSTWSQDGGVANTGHIKAMSGGGVRGTYWKRRLDILTQTGGELFLSVAFKARVGEAKDGSGAASLISLGISNETKSTLQSGNLVFLAVGLDVADANAKDNQSILVIRYRDPAIGDKPSRETRVGQPVLLQNGAWYSLDANIRRAGSSTFIVSAALSQLNDRKDEAPPILRRTVDPVTIPLGSGEKLITLLNAPGHYVGFSDGKIFGGGVHGVDNFDVFVSRSPRQ